MIVSNASPLIGLARIGKIDILPRLYGSILVPTAVWEEVVVRGAGQPGADQIASAPWVESRVPQNHSLVRALQQDLDAGEAAAIALALEVQPVFLLMDERLGRETARHLGMCCLGTVGVLVEAKRKGLLPTVGECLFALRDVAGFHLNEALVRKVISDEGEG